MSGPRGSSLIMKRKSLLRGMARLEEFTRGSVVLMKRRCVNVRCRRCSSGRRHPTWVLTSSLGGKTRTVYLGEKCVGRARRMVENYRRLRALLEEVCEVNLELLTGRELRTKGGTRDGPKREA
jgi:hypothetical protein